MATASEVIRIAAGQVGTQETGDNMTPYGAELGQNGVPWCGQFTYWCMYKAGMEKLPFNYLSAAAYAYAAECGIWGTYHAQGSGYSPKQGDIFVLNYRGGDYEYDAHVGYVAEDAPGNGWFNTYEGNASDQVMAKARAVDDYTFITPPYEASSTKFSVDEFDYDPNDGVPEETVDTYYYSENSYDEESDSENKKPTVVWNNRTSQNIHPALNSSPDIPPTSELKIYIGGKDATRFVGTLSWHNSVAEISTTMEFDMPKNDAKYLTDLIITPKEGDIVRMVTNEEIFRGVIITVNDGDEFVIKCTVADMGWYLNKTEQTYQFEEIRADDAIKELCADLCINLVCIPTLTNIISHIYFDKTVSAIIAEILSECGDNYNYDFTPQGLRIYEIGEFYAYPEFRTASNIRKLQSFDFHGELTHSISIEDMRNSVKVVSDKDNCYTELVVKQNNELINQYGFLQQIVKIDTDNENPEMIAQSKIDELAKPNIEFGFTIIEAIDSYTRAGMVTDIGNVHFLIMSTDHSIIDSVHYNKITLKCI